MFPPPPKTLNLALQGGGSHGAFTWGVLDRLLEDDGLLIEGVSGTSAGAMNAAVLLQGYGQGGNKGAREALDKFWHGVADLSAYGLPNKSLFGQMMGNWNLEASSFAGFTDMWQRMFSPYQTNPFNFNPLRALLEKMIDIPSIRNCGAIKLFVCATSVETGDARIFSREELTIDALMASGCLPFTFQAVEIEGKPYWDGGYSGNPAIYPLIYDCKSPDIALVQINPLNRRGTPESPTDIINRLNEISFNAPLISEMRAIAFMQRLIEQDRLKSDAAAEYKDINMHMISAEEEMSKLGAASKFNTNIDFLLQLKSFGRTAAEAWLTVCRDAIGVNSTIDIHKTFLD